MTRALPPTEIERRSEAHRNAIDHAIDTGRYLLAALRREADRAAEVDALRAELRLLQEYAARRWVRT